VDNWPRSGEDRKVDGSSAAAQITTSSVYSKLLERTL